MIRPLGDNIVIKRLEAEEKTQGGIILASSAKEVPQVAEVIDLRRRKGNIQKVRRH